MPRSFNRDFYENADLAPYNEVLKGAIASLPAGCRGLVISAESKEDWDILFGIMQQSWSDPISRKQSAPFNSKWGSIENHAISAEWNMDDISDSADGGHLVFGWCSVSWYRSEHWDSDHVFVTFSQIFHNSVFDTADLDEMFS